MLNYIEKTHCRVCNNKNLIEILDLKNQPLANNYHSNESQENFPLKLNLCKSCYHLQLGVVVNPDLMFKEYLYVSGTSKTLHNYFVEFVNICKKYAPRGKTVLDIACNDGTQLDKFKDAGWNTFGVDPAENLCKLSRKNHEISCSYWNEHTAEQINRSFDVVVAQNVFAHVDDIHGFLKGCKKIMEPASLLFIQTSQANMIPNNEFDTIYHEHLSFFNSNSMKKAANINGFSLIDVFNTDIHGTSYVFVLKKGAHNEDAAKNRIELERTAGLFNISTYEEYAKKCHFITEGLKAKIGEFRKNNYRVVGYGAAAKGNTFLNFGAIDLDYIVDDNELKWDLLTPGRNIPIKDPAHLAEENEDRLVIVPLAWNFFKEIKQRATQIIGSEVRFIKYFPEVRVL